MKAVLIVFTAALWGGSTGLLVPKPPPMRANPASTPPVAVPVLPSSSSPSPQQATSGHVQLAGDGALRWRADVGTDEAVDDGTGAHWFTVLDGLDKGASLDPADDGLGGAFVSFSFKTNASQHDAIVGKVPVGARMLAHSRIKRWWMAPSFPATADDVPVETQMLLLEVPRPRPRRALWGEEDHAYAQAALAMGEGGGEGAGAGEGEKTYALVAPLIDVDRGFRATLFGGKEGGAPAGKVRAQRNTSSFNPASPRRLIKSLDTNICRPLLFPASASADPS